MEIKVTAMKTMTNQDYARTIYPAELPLIVRVARHYIEKKVGSDATLEEKSIAYDEWLQADFDGEIWEKMRLERVDLGGLFEVRKSGKNRGKNEVKNKAKKGSKSG